MVMPYRFCAVFVFSLVFISTHAHAQAVPGCKPEVMEAMNAKAEAKVAYDVAVTEEIVDKPDSVLATTCFNKAAANSAKEGGDIFSDLAPAGVPASGWMGPLKTGLPTVIEEPLGVMYGNFDGAEGRDGINSGLYSSAATSLNVSGNDCDGIKDLWSRVEGSGVTGGVPYLTFSDLQKGVLPIGAAGKDFTNNFSASGSSNVFKNLDTSIKATAPSTAPSFSGNQSSCEVLRTAGVVSNCP